MSQVRSNISNKGLGLSDNKHSENNACAGPRDDRFSRNTLLNSFASISAAPPDGDRIIGKAPIMRIVLKSPFATRDIKPRICCSVKDGSLYARSELGMFKLNNDCSKAITSRYWS